MILNPSLSVMHNKSVDIGTQTSQGYYQETNLDPPSYSFLYMAAAPGP